jgi:predicted metal-binding membrane protein
VSRRTGSLSLFDSALITSALSAVVALAWFYLYELSLEMDAMDMTGLGMSRMHEWTLVDFLLIGAMWTAMMVGMMVPTALRAILIYARVAQEADSRGSPVASTGWFVLGYVFVWTGFSVVATALQSGLNQLGLLTSMMASASPLFGAALLLIEGIYQLTPWKNVCLRHCQSPALYLAGRFTRGAPGAVNLGIRHGGYCLGCCWVLMGLLFFGGVMNLVWIAAITAYVLLEKLLPMRLRAANVSGWLMIGSAALFAAISHN